MSDLRASPDRVMADAQLPEAWGESGPVGARLSLAARLMRRLLRALGDPAVEVGLWTGEDVSTAKAVPVARMRIADAPTLLKLLIDPEFQFGEAYAAGRVTVEGDLSRFLEAMYMGWSGSRLDDVRSGRLRWQVGRLRRNSVSRSRENVHHHYDLGNDFYALWLGQTMAYTCAYYPTPGATLDQAQIAKMDHICRKLRLRRGETVVEAGCGWGSFALHMARDYGVRVRAFNLSREQLSFARARAAAQGLAAQIEFVEDDFRNMRGQFDAFVSVGMLEHVGTGNYRELGQVIHRCLAPTGRGLIHSIGRNRPTPLSPWIERRIFPGAYPPSLGEMMGIFEPGGFSILDVENLRLHYARTLGHWLDGFERQSARVAAMFDETFVRMWRLYLAGSKAAFITGDMQLFQVLFAMPHCNDVPWTREHLYRNEA